MYRIQHIQLALTELLENGRLEAIDTLFSENYTAHQGNKTYHGHAFVEHYVKQIRKALSNIYVRKLEVLTQTDEVLTQQRTFSGIHTAALKGIPASNKRIVWHEIAVTRFENKLIAEEWVSSDLAFQLMMKHRPSKI
jgi:predicted ester cyclase